ncbi:MAG: Stk1 family PASTA domain-containing Ser/Thr kinase [Bacillota bacterium]|nr:Stk1 family PASTA domain-containing Ser/Thr kinase [Bacillota bacterium]
MSKVLAGRYELFERVGEGGMSVVYKAKDKLLNRFVAIKILKPEFINDPKFIDSFRRESQNAASLTHPNIVNIYDVGREGNIHYIVMELIEGRALSDYIKEQGPMAYPKVIALSKQIAAALSEAHKNHIIHRDVKPHNVMITPNGTAKITDFGIAKAVNAATIVDNTDGIVGSVHYFSPEQARGGYVDEKSDIYSLGIVMYEMLTGQVPFDGDNPVNIALQHINGEMVPPSKVVSGVPPALEHIILKCTEKYPVNRYASADELIDALNNLEFVDSVVGNSVLMGRQTQRHDPIRTTGPIAETDYDDGEIYDDDYDDYDEVKEKKPKKQKKNKGGKKNRKKLFIIAAIAAAVLLGIIFAIIFTGREEVKVPNFRGMTLEQAQELAAEPEYNLKVKEGQSVISEDIEKGLIVSQDPSADEVVKEGSTITVNISKGLGDSSVPNLVGKTEDELSDYLKAAGFKLGNVTTEASDKAEGTVIRQSPKAGETAEKGSAIDVVVSDGSLNKAVVPYLIGKSLSDAKSALSAAGLKCGEVTSEYSSAAEGEVIWQQYSSNTQLKKGASVKIKVSAGPKPTEPTTSPTEPSSEGE